MVHHVFHHPHWHWPNLKLGSQSAFGYSCPQIIRNNRRTPRWWFTWPGVSRPNHTKCIQEKTSYQQSQLINCMPSYAFCFVIWIKGVQYTLGGMRRILKQHQQILTEMESSMFAMVIRMPSMTQTSVHLHCCRLHLMSVMTSVPTYKARTAIKK